MSLSRLAPAAQVVLIGSFGAGNLGDELILAGFLAKLKKELPRIEITVLTGNPRKSKKWHADSKALFLPLLPAGLRSLLRFDWLRTVAAIRRTDAVIFPGGGLFTDDESLFAPLLWSWQLLVAKFFWKPVFLFGQSIGPFRSSFARELSRFALDKAELIGVRDIASAGELKKLGTSQGKIQLGEDSALFLKAQKMKPIKKSPTKILLSARLYPRGQAKCFAQIRAELAKYPKAKISFLEFGAGDRAAWAELGKPGKLLKAPVGAAELLRLVRQHDLVIGMRLHSLIAARLAGVPAVAVSYSRKVQEFDKYKANIKNKGIL